MTPTVVCVCNEFMSQSDAGKQHVLKQAHQLMTTGIPRARQHLLYLSLT